MAFITIPTNWINVGKAIKKELLTYIKNNLDNHEERINNIETFNAKIEVFNFEVIGYINNYTANELKNIGTYRVNQAITLTEIKIMLLNSVNSPVISSSAGVLQITLEKSGDNGITWTDILSTYPKIGDGKYLTGEVSDLVEFVTNGEFLVENDLLRVNITSKKDTQGSFLISVYAELT